MMLQNLAQITNYSLEKGRNGSEEAYELGSEWAELKRSSWTCNLKMHPQSSGGAWDSEWTQSQMRLWRGTRQGFVFSGVRCLHCVSAWPSRLSTKRNKWQRCPPIPFNGNVVKDRNFGAGGCRGQIQARSSLALYHWPRAQALLLWALCPHLYCRGVEKGLMLGGNEIVEADLLAQNST